ncbi:hypothetical protein [Solimonas terrae]|uniref:BcpO-related WXXGXW repeat protein n=1 Tax=Solimonas terrae TaxID=1396819 RepID=A0A6M2BNJ3_9GAMM|nr:hypothetical protein [Solimonas terrae]NGY04176.1 hypothetical protein [Solimonas terrae]
MVGTLKVAIAALALSLPVAAAFAAPKAPSPGHAAEHGAHHYIYYPDKRIYYAPETQMWFWPDGDSWMSGGALPVFYQQYASRGYNVYLDVSRPYEAQRDVSAGYRRHQWTPYHYGDDSDDRDASDHRRHGGAGK